MKLNNKGWGTLQMFLLMTGLLIALIVAVYFISVFYGSFSNSIANRHYANLEARLSEAAKLYVNFNNLDLNDSDRIYYSTLKQTGYIGDLVDNNGDLCDGYVTYIKADRLDVFRPTLICKNYETKYY